MTSHNLPENDLYGRLFFYIRDRLLKMAKTLQRIPVNVELHQKDAHDLAKDLKKRGIFLDRIDVYNICDKNYLGIQTVLRDWAPLLNRSNPNSALVTLFMNWWFMEVTKGGIPRSKMPEKVQQMAVARLLELCKAVMYKLEVVGYMVWDLCQEFGSYLEKQLAGVDESVGVKKRNVHRIVPHRLFLPIEAEKNSTLEKLSDEQFYLAMVFGCNRTERYVEWELED